MESIKNKVAIVGMGCTKFGERYDMGVEDLLVEAAYEACQDAGIEPKDIQAAWLGTVFSGMSAITLAPLGLQYIPVTRVENMCATGSEALRAASYAVAAGVVDIALAIGVEKLKDTGTTGVKGPALVGDNLDGTAGIGPGYSAPASFAYLASRYFAEYKMNPEDGRRLLAQIAVKNHHNGSLNPKAHFSNQVTVEQAMKAPIVAYPLGLFDCCGVSDGAAAAIVTRADMAKKFRDDPIYIKALSIAVGARQGAMVQDYDFVHLEENVRASQKAYADAGIKDPRKEISMAEVHDCFTVHEMIVYEDLQFAKRGRAKEDIEAGSFTLTGDLPVNTDGGLKCFGHPLGASGLRMMYEVYHQLREKAGPRQIKNPRLGLTHNLGGNAGTGIASVFIVGNEK
ncbi:MAG: acetyl-CoA acetyltransferase [Syntrophorhabdus sp. PtaU1.Bin050]|jgi:acetyl-CoA C-acetyltransferase|nr:MAG: acetyl-CoA acetyltransferase [Syntrophorhabdus sp. PtaU1.Bin050]